MDGIAWRCACMLGLDCTLISVCLYYTSTQGEPEMHSRIKKLKQHVPLMFALLYLVSGDYSSLIRHLQLLL